MTATSGEEQLKKQVKVTDKVSGYRVLENNGEAVALEVSYESSLHVRGKVPVTCAAWYWNAPTDWPQQCIAHGSVSVESEI